jgi:hypothetical protein
MSGFPTYRYRAYDYRKEAPERLSRPQLKQICSGTGYPNSLCGPDIEEAICLEPRSYYPNLTLLNDEARFDLNMPAADFRPSGDTRGVIPCTYTTRCRGPCVQTFFYKPVTSVIFEPREINEDRHMTIYYGRGKYWPIRQIDILYQTVAAIFMHPFIDDNDRLQINYCLDSIPAGGGARACTWIPGMTHEEVRAVYHFEDADTCYVCSDWRSRIPAPHVDPQSQELVHDADVGTVHPSLSPVPE